MNNKVLNELLDLFKYNYHDCCAYLQNKYGIPKEPYMIIAKSGNWRINDKIKRFKSDRLYIHHIEEIKYNLLSKLPYASEFPYEYQLPNSLCYCNVLEHLVLHFMIEKMINRDGNNDKWGSTLVYISSFKEPENKHIADLIIENIKHSFSDTYWKKWNSYVYTLSSMRFK